MSVTSKEIWGLYRTFYPKYAHYMSDGMGRDTYILKHNGGMCNEGSRPLFETTMYNKERPSGMPPAPLKDATSFKYVSDGSGRDFYITYNSGGLEAPYIPGTQKSEHQFIWSLRSNLNNNQQKRLSTPAEKMRMKKCRSAQRLLVRRLTATSKEWKEINQEAKKQSISREREARSPVINPQTQLHSYQMSRNSIIRNSGMIWQPDQSEVNSSSQKYSYPIYSRSTRNILQNKVKQNSENLKKKNKQSHSNFMANKPVYTKTTNFSEAKLRDQLLRNYHDLMQKAHQHTRTPMSLKGVHLGTAKRNSMSDTKNLSNFNKIEELRGSVVKNMYPSLIEATAASQKKVDEISTTNLRREIQKLRRKSVANC